MRRKTRSKSSSGKTAPKETLPPDVVALLRKGVPVVPCHTAQDGVCSCGDTSCSKPGEHPRVPIDGITSAPTVAVLEEWTLEYPEGRWGVLLGRPAGLMAFAGSADALVESIERLGPWSDEVFGSLTLQRAGKLLVLLRRGQGGTVANAALPGGVEVIGGDGEVVIVGDADAKWMSPLDEADVLEAPPELMQLIEGMQGGGDVSPSLAELAKLRIIELFKSTTQEGWATVRIKGHAENLLVRSKDFELLLRRIYHEHAIELDIRPREVTPKQLREAVAELEAEAIFDGAEKPVHVRTAEHAGNLYLDLGTVAWEAVEIGSEGWRIIRNAPAKFRRPPTMQPLPVPVSGGSIEELRPFLNLSSEAHFVLLVGWLLAALRPNRPYPLLFLRGEHGTTKTTTARILRGLIDPVRADMLTTPRNERDLYIAAERSLVIGFDNLSEISPTFADALCRMATGGGFATRRLYTDREEIVIDVRRPILITGINDLLTRHDLADRAFVVTLPTIDDSKRRTEADIWADFAQAAPRILGALLDAASCALKRLSKVHGTLGELPRMADVAEWVTAAEPALGWEHGTLLRAYGANRREAVDAAIDGDVVASVVCKLMSKQSEVNKEPRVLLKELERLAGDEAKVRAGWPGAPSALSAALRRAAPFLRTRGIIVEFGRAGRGIERRRTITLRRVEVSSSFEEPSQ